MPIYLTGRKEVGAWLAQPGLKKVEAGGAEFYLPAVEPRSRQAALEAILPMLDADIEKGEMKKRSKTRASIFKLADGSNIFAKAVWTTKMPFVNRLRYLVAPSRSLWAAAVSRRLEEIGIPTPAVLAAGERRRHGMLAASYLVTDVLEKGEQLSVWFSATEADDDAILSRLRDAGAVMRLMHEKGVSHRDATPLNSYVECDEDDEGGRGRIGFWDLDPVVLMNKPVPAADAAERYAQYLGGFLRALDRNPHAAERSERLFDAAALVECIAGFEPESVKRQAAAMLKESLDGMTARGKGLARQVRF